ncbi:TetR/AcrR family transcriptional regulator [Kitasatospora sp. NPDC057198]|uniref:TetR/AcrR family transcriptional regulator n=1 Tax=Kitasatospora sp. NPDC057198 TaxID=3346046 RepID=UPI00362824C2
MSSTTQKLIIETARQEFAERGYGATSIRDIARRSGMSLSALYHYYPGKQELLRAIIDEGMDEYFGSCDQALERAGDDPAERLAALVEATVRFRAEHPAKSSITITEQRSLEPEHLAAYEARIAGATQQWAGIIRAGLDEGVFTTPYPDDARRAVIAMCNAVAQWYRPGGELGEDDLVERYVSLALTIVEYRPRGVVRRPAR